MKNIITTIANYSNELKLAPFDRLFLGFFFVWKLFHKTQEFPINSKFYIILQSNWTKFENKKKSHTYTKTQTATNIYRDKYTYTNTNTLSNKCKAIVKCNYLYWIIFENKFSNNWNNAFCVLFFIIFHKLIGNLWY